MTIIYFIVGLMFCVLPNIMLATFETMVCFALLVYGSVIMFAYCISPVVAQNKKLMISAIISIIIGVFLLLVRSFFVLAMAIVLLLLVIFKIMVLKKTAGEKNANWFVWMALLCFEAVACGLMIVFFIINKLLAVSMILMGAAMILEALANVFMLFRNQNNLKKNAKVQS